MTKKPKQMNEKIEDFKFSNWEDYAKTLEAEIEEEKKDGDDARYGLALALAEVKGLKKDEFCNLSQTDKIVSL